MRHKYLPLGLSCKSTHSFWVGLMYVCIGEGNGTRLQYSRLENPMDGGAW